MHISVNFRYLVSIFYSIVSPITPGVRFSSTFLQRKYVAQLLLRESTIGVWTRVTRTFWRDLRTVLNAICMLHVRVTGVLRLLWTLPQSILIDNCVSMPCQWVSITYVRGENVVENSTPVIFQFQFNFTTFSFYLEKPKRSAIFR